MTLYTKYKPDFNWVKYSHSFRNNFNFIFAELKHKIGPVEDSCFKKTGKKHQRLLKCLVALEYKPHMPA
jgi:hypothetical protein